MKRLQTALAEVAKALDAAGVGYMVIGGMAHVAWGSARSTVDVDLTVLLAPEDVPELLRILRRQIANLPEDPAGFAAETGVLPFAHRNGVRVELMLATHPYAQTAIDRAISIDVLGTPVRFCTPEDLVLHKIISDRERDRSDVQDLLERRGKELDREYLDPRVHELATLLERPEIETRYRSLLAVTRS